MSKKKLLINLLVLMVAGLAVSACTTSNTSLDNGNGSRVSCFSFGILDAITIFHSHNDCVRSYEQRGYYQR